MKIVFECFLRGAALAFLLIQASHAHAAENLPIIRVVVYGDSLVAGYQLQPEESYPASLERKLRGLGFDNVRVINLGSYGETSTGAADNINTLLAQRPDIAIVEFGSNDVQRGITTNIIFHNLATVVGTLSQNNIYTILMGIKAKPDLGATYASQLDEAYSRIATHYKIPLYPDTLEGVSGHSELTLADGIHPNAKGVDVMVENTYRMVDAAVRWKIETYRYEQEYQKQLKDNPVIPSPPPP